MDQKWRMLVVLHLTMVAADLQVYPKVDPFIIMADFLDQEANFGVEIPTKGVSALLVAAEPADACAPIERPPTVPNPANYYWAVLIKRYNCSFEQKVLNAQNAFYDVAIVHNVDSNKLEIMNASHPDQINIISVFITANAGRELRTKYLYDQGYIVRIDPNTSGDILGKILIPFIVIISACFILMIGFMIVKCIKDHRRERRRRLPYSSLNRIPTTRFRKNDPFETCAICLDDFIEGEKLRVLPCSHAYHCKCIDPWLTRNRRVCPMCKRKVFAAGDRIDSGDSSSDDDHTPLLRGRNNQSNSTYGGTRSADEVDELIRSFLVRHVESVAPQPRQGSLTPPLTLHDALMNHRRRVLERMGERQAFTGAGSSSNSAPRSPDAVQQAARDSGEEDSDSGHEPSSSSSSSPGNSSYVGILSQLVGEIVNGDHRDDGDHHGDDHHGDDHHGDDHQGDDHHSDSGHHQDDDHQAHDYSHDYDSHDVDYHGVDHHDYSYDYDC